MDSDDPSPPAGTNRAWAAPESAAPGAHAPSPPSGAGDPAVPATAPRAAPPRVPVPLRPMTIPDLLDGGFAVLRLAPRTVLTVAAVFVVPLSVVSAYLQRQTLEDVDRLLANPTLADTSGGGGGEVILTTLGSSLATTLVAAGLARVVAGWYGGHEVGPAAALRGVLRASPALVTAWIITHVALVAGAVLLLVPAFAVMALFLVLAPVVAVEGVGPFAAIRRAAQLGMRRFWPLLGVGVLTGLIGGVLATVLSAVPQVVAVVIGADYGWILLGVGSAAAGLVATSVVAGSTVLAYLDVRVRTEGLDLELAATEHLPQ